MKKKIVVPILIIILLLTMACTDEVDDFFARLEKRQERVNALMTLEAVNTEEPESVPAVVTPQPTATIQPTATQEYPPHTYSVETTNVGTCICPVRSGEVEFALVFKGDNLEMPNVMGEPLSFTKVDENRYDFRYMMEKRTGPEEAMKVVTIFDWGFKEEFYIKNSSKLCCVYDYLRLDN